MGNKKEKRMNEIFDISISNFKSMNQQLHMVLFYKHRIFDFMPDDCKVRPFNAVKWYPIDQEQYEDFINLMKAICESILDHQDENFSDVSYGIMIGVKSKNILAIDIEKVEQLYREYRTEIKEPSTEEIIGAGIIASQCRMLMMYLDEIYDFWESILKYIDLQ